MHGANLHCMEETYVLVTLDILKFRATATLLGYTGYRVVRATTIRYFCMSMVTKMISLTHLLSMVTK